MHHDDDDWCGFVAFMLAGEGRSWFAITFTTCAAIALLLWHYFG